MAHTPFVLVVAWQSIVRLDAPSDEPVGQHAPPPFTDTVQRIISSQALEQNQQTLGRDVFVSRCRGDGRNLITELRGVVLTTFPGLNQRAVQCVHLSSQTAATLAPSILVFRQGVVTLDHHPRSQSGVLRPIA
ncbi:MAG TPA: hypothetical protein VNV25_08460 [Gemmatimonadaceae bacterium]|nr:hypothetical protein [Gemmatimonadaceae bacterium]